jgi:alanyl-tRNA synthetase
MAWAKVWLYVKIQIMKRLYWTDPDAFESEVEVRTIAGCKVAIHPVIFHPDEGGQPADKGTIGDAMVCNVEMVEDQIVHTLDKPLADGKYTARIDKQHRLYTAAQHTAQHILSGIAEKQFGLRTTGVHIGLEKSTVDFDRKIEWGIAAEVERRSMEVVCLDIPVETVFNDADVRAGAASGKIESDTIRVVKIGDYDKSACCGAHLRSTGQIGIIRILGIESKKEGTRMVFLAGDKALEYSQLETSVLRELRKVAGCSTAELPAQLQKAMDRAGELSKEIGRLWSLLLPDLVESAQIIEVESSKIGIQVADVPTALLAKLAAMIAEAADGAGIAVSGLNIAVFSSRIDARDILNRIQNVAGGKGGGSPKAANGRLAKSLAPEEIAAILISGTK